MSAERARGFTLVELVMSIAIGGILAVGASRFMAQSMDAYLQLRDRAVLADHAQTAQARLAGELRLAVPHTVRVAAGGHAVEFLRARTAGRFRAHGPGDTPQPGVARGRVEVPGGLAAADAVRWRVDAGLQDCLAGVVDCLVVQDAAPGADAWAGDTLAAVTTASATALAYARDTPFPGGSPAQRFHVSDGPVSFLCEGGAVLRYSGHAVTASHAAVDSGAEIVAAGGRGSRLAGDVTACRFAYRPGDATRGAVLTAVITLTRGGESVTLLEQVGLGELP